MNQKPNGWSGSSTRSRNAFPAIYASQHWILRMRRWLLQMRRWLLRVRRWLLRMRRWLLRMRRWLLRMRRWLLRMRRWLWKPKIHQSSQETGFSLVFLLYFSAWRRRFSRIAGSPRQPILSTGFLQLWFRLCGYLFFPLKRSGKCSYLGRTYWLEMYQDEAAYAWPSVFQTDYEPSLNSGLWRRKPPAVFLTQHTGLTFLGMTFNFSMGLILVSFWGYSLVLLWNWVPSKPPTKLPLPPSLDYIHFYSCKILLGCIFTPVFAGSIMLTSACGFYATFHPLLNILRMIRRSVLVCVASTSRFLNAISIAMTARGSVLNIFIPFGQVTSSVLVRVGFISLLQIVAESLSKTTFVQRIFRLCEWTFVTLCIAYSFAITVKIINFLSGFGLLYSFVLAIVSAIAPVGLWIPTIAAQDYTNLPNLLRVVYTFGCISISILSGTSFIKIGITLYEKLMTRSRYGVHGV